MLDLLARHDVKFLPVSSYGRAGSSYLMALLAASGVQVAGELPFEDRTVQVGFLSWLGGRLGGPETGGGKARYFGIDYNSDVLREAADGTEKRDRLEAYIASVAGGWIGEKLVGMQLFRLMRATDERGLVRPIYLLRDPRDIFISVKAFNAQRGFASFGDTGDDRRLLQIICDFQKGQLVEQQRGGLALHYEDLVARREQTMVALLRHIGRRTISAEALDSILAQVPAAGEAVRGHMTSRTAQESVHRWQAAEFKPYRALFAQLAEPISACLYPA